MRVRGLALGVLGVLCLVLVLGVGPAVAGVSQFGSKGSGAGQLSNEPAGVAVEQESGDVYVVDKNNARVDKFGPEGEFLLAWGWGVADGHSEALQTCTSVCFGGIDGAGGGQLSAFAEGVAVDNDPLSSSHGDVYVFDIRNNRVEKFNSAGNFLLAFGHEVNETTHGNVCLAGESCQAGTSGTGTGEFEPETGDHIAVNPVGMVYVGDENRVQEFSPGGAYEGQIALPGAGRIKALAVDSSGAVYVEGSELAGVHKYSGAGVELGEPRNPSSNPLSGNAIVVGPSDELFIDSGEGPHHLLEFDPAGNQVASFDAGPEPGNYGIAFGDGISELYVLERGVVRLVSLPSAGPLVLAGSESAGELQPTTATLNATINPEGHETSYSFEYGTSAAYGSSTTPTALTGGSFEDQPASAALSELQPRTLYHFRVVATDNAGPTPHTTFGPDETFTTLPPALIDSESASGVTAKGATLATQLNPLGRDTRFRFEYGPSTGYGTSVPVPDGDAGAGTVDVALSALIGHLSPGTTYHYRVVAFNSLGTVEGPDRVFATQAAEAPALLDGRAWEMVSPPDKRGAALESIGLPTGGLIQAARDGGAISYVASGPIEEEPKGNRSLEYTQVLSTRGQDGWSSKGIATPSEAPAIGFNNGDTSAYRAFSTDLSVSLLEPVSETPLSPAASERTPYLRESNGEFTPLVTAGNVPPGTKFGGIAETGSQGIKGQVEVAGATPDLSHVVLSSEQALTPGFTSGGNTSLYEWAGGSLSLVSVLPDLRPAAEEGAVAILATDRAPSHAISIDGSRIFWTAFSHLYMTDMNLGRSVQLDVVGEGAQGGSGSPLFQTASGDGSKVFFTDTSRLTPDATSRQATSGQTTTRDLYMCEVGVVAGEPTCRLKDLTADEHADEAADVQGVVMGAGEDGRYIYFVADGVLAPGAAAGDCEYQTGTHTPGLVCNLYVYDTVMGERRFIAELSSGDAADWEAFQGISGDLNVLTSRVSPNGRYLAFMSERSLTRYDNIDAHSGQADAEVFLYDLSTGRVVCASCNPSGARPTGVFDSGVYPGLLVDRSSSWPGRWLAASIPGWTQVKVDTAWYQSRYLSDSGRLFFDAADALVGRDTNGREDVYEYEPGGVGGCAGVTGCVGLVSSGASGEESAFLDASESGDEVFFLTASRLMGQDFDNALDVYDARVCSASSPCLAGAVVPPAAPCASGESCRGAASPQAEAFAVPSSTGVSGAGNLTAPASGPAVKTRRLTRAQKLASALRACRKKPRRGRASCKARARRLYGSGAKAKRAGSAGATSKGNR